MYSTLILDIAGQIAAITLNRPDKRNAMSAAMIAELQSALDEIEKSHARVGILTGAGKAFCSGMDLEMLAAIAQQSPAENLVARSKELAQVLIAASPGSLSRAKRLMTSSAAPSVDHDLERAILESARIRCTPDFKEGLASFLEKRKPVWQGKPE